MAGLRCKLLLAVVFSAAPVQGQFATISWWLPPPAGLNPLGGDVIHVGGTSLLNAAQPTRGIYANYSTGAAGVAPLTTGLCAIQSTTNMTCTTVPGFGNGYTFTFWMTTSSLSPISQTVATVASYAGPAITAATVLGGATITSTSALPLRVAGNLMIDLSAADFNPTTNLWDNKVTGGAISTANGDFGVINYGSSSDLPPTLTAFSNVTAVYFPYTNTGAYVSISTSSVPSAPGSSAGLFSPMYGSGAWSMESLIMQVTPPTGAPTATEINTESPMFQWGARGANTCNGAFLSLGHHPIWGAGGFFNCDIYWSAGESERERERERQRKI